MGAGIVIQSQNLSVVTGATGHIGFALVQALCKKGEKPRILVRKESALFNNINVETAFGDVTDLDTLIKAFSGADIVYHLAGMIEVNSGNDDRVYTVNVQGTQNVIEACRICNVRRLVYASSVDAYIPRPGNELMKEVYHFEPEKLDGTYAKTKAIATNAVFESISDTFECVVVYPGACIGPYDFKVSSIGEMVRRFVRGAFPVSLAFGKYNFVDVRDVASAMITAAETAPSGSGYILTGEQLTVDEFIAILSDACARKTPSFKMPKWIASTAAPFAEAYYKAVRKTPIFTRYSIRKLCANCNFSHEKAEKELGYNPMTVRHSLEDMVDWIIKHENIKNNE